MLTGIILAGIALLLLMLFLGWAVRQPPSTIKTALLAFALTLVGVLGLALLMTGRLAGLIALLAGLSPWLARATRLHQAWQLYRRLTGRRHDRPAPPPAAESARMTRAQALEILGLPADATADDIRAAHRRLMQANHPDRGGSTWIATRLNQARDLLLR